MISDIVLRSEIRTYFKSFVIKTFNEISGSDKFCNNWHIDAICFAIEQMIKGDNNRQIINIPPRSLKSIICSVALPAFLLGQKPETRIICVSYDDGLAAKLASDCLRVMQSDWYKDLFPNTRIVKTAVTEIETSANGCRFAASIGGAIIGRGADWIIIDDPQKPADMAYDTMRAKAYDLYKSSLITRFNNPETGKLLLVMQRLNPNDLTGCLLASNSNYNLLRIPLIADQDTNYVIKKVEDVPIYHTVRKNEILHPERFTEKFVKEQRETMGEYDFSAQYQQNPKPVGGNLISMNKLHFYQTVNNIKFTKLVFSWDTASKIGVDTSYSVCVLFGIANNISYVLDVFRQRLEFPQLVNAVSDFYIRKTAEYACYDADILIEDASSGTQLIQNLRAIGRSPIGIKSTTSKEVRFAGITPDIVAGKYLFPCNNRTWWSDFIDELTTFPASSYKDQVDALSQGIEYIRKRQIVTQNKPKPCSMTVNMWQPENPFHLIPEWMKNGAKYTQN